MSDDRDWGSDIEEMGPGDVPEPGPDEPELIETERDTAAPDEPGSAETPVAASEAEEKHGFKQATRDTVGKAVGIAVELGSILGGQGGEIVGAERSVAEAETEELIDRVDGDG